ncbi:MAG TPA: hypothetical protein VKY65_16150 [Alphaproteobacteria bacterium]|nr:hypothetical protein [Alphaproteobacteria bacterium]
MASYWCYFLDEESTLADGEGVVAESDDAARLASERLFLAARDAFLGFEVWQGSRFVHRHIKPLPQIRAVAPSKAAVAAKPAAEVVELEERRLLVNG